MARGIRLEVQLDGCWFLLLTEKVCIYLPFLEAQR